MTARRRSGGRTEDPGPRRWPARRSVVIGVVGLLAFLAVPGVVLAIGAWRFAEYRYAAPGPDAQRAAASVGPRPHDPGRPTAVVVVGEHGANVSDTLVPSEILAGTGAFNVYTVAIGDRPIRSRHGLAFVPRADPRAVAEVDRLLVPASTTDAAAGPTLAGAVRAGIPVEHLRGPGGSAFDEALRVMAWTQDRATARWTAVILEYPPEDLRIEGPHWPWGPRSWRWASVSRGRRRWSGWRGFEPADLLCLGVVRRPHGRTHRARASPGDSPARWGCSSGVGSPGRPSGPVIDGCGGDVTAPRGCENGAGRAPGRVTPSAGPPPAAGRAARRPVSPARPSTR